MSQRPLVATDSAPHGLVDVVDASPKLARQAGDSLQALNASVKTHHVSGVSLRYSPNRPGRGAAPASAPTVAPSLPGPIADLLVSVLTEIAGGHGVTVLRTGSDLSTTQAARLLGCSRPHIAKLIAHGEIPAYAVGAHRRIKLADALAFQRAREAQTAELDHLAGLSAMFPPDGPLPVKTTPTSNKPPKARRPTRSSR